MRSLSHATGISLNRLARLSVAAIVGLVVLSLAGCEKHEPPARAPIKVTVAQPVTQAVQDYITLDGTISPLLRVNLEARVPGYLRQILFKDGAAVKENDLLFVIEQDQYQQEVDLNKAIFEQAQIEFDRQSTLLAQKATSQAAVDSARSQLQQAQANLALANINLGYTEVRAPFDGVMGRHLIDVGNYLGNSPDGIKLAEIRQLQPLYVYFSMSETELLRLKRSSNEAGAPGALQVGKTRVYAALQGDEGFPHEGVLDFVASDLSTETGALELRAVFDNTANRLVPGMYARVLAYYGSQRQAMLVPFAAVMRDQQGAFVYTVDADKKAQRTNITLGQRFGALVEVTKGLGPTDQVVINGFVTLSAGAGVDAETGKVEPVKLPGHDD